MNIYIAIIAVILVSLFFYKEDRNNLLVYIIDCTMLFVIVALRDVSVGNDTEDYVKQALGILEHVDYKAAIEKIWMLVLSIFNNQSDSASRFLQLTAILELIPLFFIIRKESDNEIISLMVFTVLNTGLCFYMTGIRQSIAIAFTLFAFRYLKEKKYFLSSLFILIGAGFHATALLSFLFIPFGLLKINKNLAYSILGASVLIGFISKINIFNAYSGISKLFFSLSFYMNYSSYEIMRVPNIFGLVTIIVPSTIIAACAISINNNDVFTRLFFLGVVLVNLFASTPTIERYFVYLTMLQLFIIPKLYRNGNSFIKVLLFISIALLFFNFFRSVPFSTGTDNYMLFKN